MKNAPTSEAQREAYQTELSGLEARRAEGDLSHFTTRRIMWLRRWLGQPESGEKPKPKGTVESPAPNREEKREAGEAPKPARGKTKAIEK